MVQARSQSIRCDGVYSNASGRSAYTYDFCAEPIGES